MYFIGSVARNAEDTLKTFSDNLSDFGYNHIISAVMITHDYFPFFHSLA